MLRSVLFGLVVSMLASCGRGQLRDADDLDGVLPYRVAIYFDQASSSLPVLTTEEEVPASAPRFEWTGDQIANAIADSLVNDHELVSEAIVVSASSVEEARRQASRCEYLLLLGVEAPQEFAPPARSWGWGTLEVVSWLFGGVPAWFVPTVSYPTDTHLIARIFDMREDVGEEGLQAGIEQNIFVRSTSLSLWNRAPIGDNPGNYALTFLVPPMALRSEDRTAEGEQVTANLVSELVDAFAAVLRRDLVEQELDRPFRAAFLSPVAGASISGSPPVRLEIVSRGGVPIEELQLRREAASVPVYLWKSGPERLDALNAELQANEQGRARLELPDEIPFVPGRNVVRIGAVRADGTRLTRTVVYHYEES